MTTYGQGSKVFKEISAIKGDPNEKRKPRVANGYGDDFEMISLS